MSERWTRFFASRWGIILAGAVIRPSPETSGIFEWMAKRGIPVVSMRDIHNPDIPHIRLDSSVMLEGALRHLAGLGHGRILLLDTGLVEVPTVPGLEVTDIRVGPTWPSAVAIGRRLAGEWRDSIKRSDFDAVFITDDCVALGFILESRALGVKLPGDLAVMVACNSGQLLDAFADCERSVLSTRQIARKILDLYRSVTSRDAKEVDPNVYWNILARPR